MAEGRLLEQWLESRWLGRFLPTLNDAGYHSLQQLTALPLEEKAAIIRLFEKPGHRLKIRLLLEDLERKNGKFSSVNESDENVSDSEVDSDNEDNDGDEEIEERPTVGVGLVVAPSLGAPPSLPARRPMMDDDDEKIMSKKALEEQKEREALEKSLSTPAGPPVGTMPPRAAQVKKNGNGSASASPVPVITTLPPQPPTKPGAPPKSPKSSGFAAASPPLPPPPMLDNDEEEEPPREAPQPPLKKPIFEKQTSNSTTSQKPNFDKQNSNASIASQKPVLDKTTSYSGTSKTNNLPPRFAIAARAPQATAFDDDEDLPPPPPGFDESKFPGAAQSGSFNQAPIKRTHPASRVHADDLGSPISEDAAAESDSDSENARARAHFDHDPDEDGLARRAKLQEQRALGQASGRDTNRSDEAPPEVNTLPPLPAGDSSGEEDENEEGEDDEPEVEEEQDSEEEDRLQLRELRKSMHGELPPSTSRQASMQNANIYEDDEMPPPPAAPAAPAAAPAPAAVATIQALAKKRESEKRDFEKREAEKREAERQEAEKKEAEKREAERREAEKREAEKKEAEKREAAAKKETLKKAVPILAPAPEPELMAVPAVPISPKNAGGLAAVGNTAKLPSKVAAVAASIASAPAPTPAASSSTVGKSVAVGSPTTSPLSSPIASGNVSNIRDKFKMFNQQPQPSASTAPTASVASPNNGAGGGVMGLRERLAKLQQAAQTDASKGQEKKAVAPSIAGSNEEFKKKMAGVAMTIGSQLMMAQPPPHIAAKLAPPPAVVTDEAVVQEIGEEDELTYDMPPVSHLTEPTKTGSLEKRSGPPGRVDKEYQQRYCVLKDDTLFWLKNRGDNRPAGCIWLAEPGLQIDFDEDQSEMTIKTKKKEYVFRAVTTDELNLWYSKLRVAKMLYKGAATSPIIKIHRKPGQPSSHAQQPPSPTSQQAASMSSAAASGVASPSIVSPAHGRPVNALAFQQEAASKALQAAIMGKKVDQLAVEPQHYQQQYQQQSGAEDELQPPGPPVETEEDEEEKLQQQQQQLLYQQEYQQQQAYAQQQHAYAQQQYAEKHYAAGGGKSVRNPEDERGEKAARRENLARDAEEERMRQAEMLRRGAIFIKYKHRKGQRRCIWTPTPDKIAWGDEKKKGIKGYMLLIDLEQVIDGCPSAKRKDLAFTIVSNQRTLELEATDSNQKMQWVTAIRSLIANK